MSNAACSVCGPFADGAPTIGNAVVSRAGRPRLAATAGSRDEASAAGTPILVSTATIDELRTRASSVVDWLRSVSEKL